MLTQEQVRSKLTYNPDTGEFHWISSGKLAGHYKHHSGYGYVGLGGKQRAAHKLAWLYVYGHWPQHPQEQIDHINRDRSDNRIENLRLVEHGENDKNRSRYKNSTGPVTGVYWVPERKKWRATLNVNKTRYSLGNFESLFDAVAARKSAEITHGFYARNEV